MDKLQRVALVTGGTSGIGHGICRVLAQKGYNVVCIGSQWESISDITLPLLTPGQRHKLMCIDLSQWPQWMSEKHPSISLEGPRTRTELGSTGLDDYRSMGVLQLVVNCAGVAQYKPTTKLSIQDQMQLFNVNVNSPIAITQWAMKRFVRERYRLGRTPTANPGTGASAYRPCVLNVSSVLAQRETLQPGTAVYAATKAALSQYTLSLQNELVGRNLSVKLWEPAYVSTRMTRNLPHSQPGTESLQKALQSFETILRDELVGKNFPDI